jgi:hypothetical protein
LVWLCTAADMGIQCTIVSFTLSQAALGVSMPKQVMLYALHVSQLAHFAAVCSGLVVCCCQDTAYVLAPVFQDCVLLLLLPPCCFFARLK